MTMKFASLTFTALLAAGSLLAMPVGQDQAAPAPAPAAAPHHQADPNRQLKMLTNRLSLTADQQNQILPILTDRQTQMAAIQNDSSLSKKDLHAKMKALRSDSDAKLRAVLTDSQRATYDQMQQKQRERGQAHSQNAVNPS